MNGNLLHSLVGVFAIATAIFGYQLYQEQHKTTGIAIEVGKNGISIGQK